MAYEVEFSGQFKKDIKRCKKRNFDIPLLETVLKILRRKGNLPSKYKSHKLSGNYKDFWECHIKPDWLLIWNQDNVQKVIKLDRTGTHSDLFK